MTEPKRNMEDLAGRKICIVNGDDFGASSGINRGIIEAFTDGILTSASLMINMPAWQEAAEFSLEHPGLSVGLHVNFTNEGEPMLDLSDIGAVRSELEKQYHLFTERLNRPPTHIDSHHNIHQIPDLLPLFVELANRYRLPLREYSPVRYFSNFYGYWDGESHPEHISLDRLIQVLDSEIQPGITELACHPGYVTDDFRSEYNIEREVELRSLCSEAAKRRVEELSIELLNYPEALEAFRQCNEKEAAN